MDKNIVDIVTKTAMSVSPKEKDDGIKVGVSARHVHLYRRIWKHCSGKAANWTPKKRFYGRSVCGRRVRNTGKSVTKNNRRRKRVRSCSLITD